MIVKKTASRFDIQWETNPISRQVYKRLREYFVGTGYGPAGAAEHAKIATLAAENELSPAQVTSIRNIVIKDKIIKNHGRMNAMITGLSAAYNSASILQVAAKYDFPPLNLFRGIMLHRGVSASDMYKIYTYKVPPESILRGRDLEQYILAERNDANSTFNQDLAAERAAAAELDFVNMLKGRGISVRTQDELAREQIAAVGRAVNTPDVLFDCEVNINGSPVKWIDYKDYIGTNTSFLIKSNKAQAARYVAEWGPGAMCYGPGFIDDVAIPGTMMLDCTGILPPH